MESTAHLKSLTVVKPIVLMSLRLSLLIFSANISHSKCNLEVSNSGDYSSSASSTPSSLRVSLWMNQCRRLRSHPVSLVMHWQRLSTQQTVELFSCETDTNVYILHRCFLCPEGPRGGGHPNTNMVSFSHGGLSHFEWLFGAISSLFPQYDCLFWSAFVMCVFYYVALQRMIMDPLYQVFLLFKSSSLYLISC